MDRAKNETSVFQPDLPHKSRKGWPSACQDRAFRKNAHVQFNRETHCTELSRRCCDPNRSSQTRILQYDREGCPFLTRVSHGSNSLPVSRTIFWTAAAAPAAQRQPALWGRG